MDYNKVQTLSAATFAETKSDDKDMVVQDSETLRKVEQILDVMPGVLDAVEQRFSNSMCSCGNTISLYDFTISAIIDGEHSKSFLLHTFLGNKYIAGEPRPVRCIQCGVMSKLRHSYDMPRYKCKVYDVADDI